MAEQFVPRKAKRTDSTFSPSGRILVLVASLLTAGLVGVLVWQYLVVPAFQVKRVVVRGDVSLSETEIVRRAGIQARDVMFRVDLESMADKLEQHHLVRTAKVRRELPNTLVIELQRRRPLLLALVSDEKGLTPITVDADGVVVTRGDDVEDWDLPVLSGLDFRTTAPGTKLPEMLLPMLKDLRNIQLDAPNLFYMFSELQIEPRAGGGFDIVAFPKETPVRVRLNDRVNQETFGYVAMVLDVLTRQGAAEAVQEIDFRAGEVVYRIKEVKGAR